MKARHSGLGQVGLLYLEPYGVSCEDSFALILLLYQGTPPRPGAVRAWYGEAKLDVAWNVVWWGKGRKGKNHAA